MSTEEQLENALAELHRVSEELEQTREDLQAMAVEATHYRREAEALDHENTTLKAVIFELQTGTGSR